MSMAVRNQRVEVRLTRDEHAALMKKARKAGLSTGAFVRMAVAGKEVREAPSVDVPLLIREVRRVGVNINQLLLLANMRGWPEKEMLQKAFEETRAMEKMISNAYGTAWQ